MVDAIVNVVIAVLDKLGYFGIFFGMALESACIPIPSEAILPFGGYLAYKGRLGLILMILIGTLGALAGSILAYFVGSLGGRPLLDKISNKFKSTKSKIDKSEEYFNKYGEKIVFFSRVLPVIRTFISLPAGISKMNFKKFVVYSFAGSLIWSIFLGYAGYIMGENWTMIRSWFHYADIAIVIAIVIFVIYIIRKMKKKDN